MKTTGEIIALNIRRGADWAARYGGEEFFLCFPGADAKAVYTVLGRIRAQITIHPFLHGDTVIRSSVSIGLAELQPDDDHAALIERSDALLYRAKSNGKNRIEQLQTRLIKKPPRECQALGKRTEKKIAQQK